MSSFANKLIEKIPDPRILSIKTQRLLSILFEEIKLVKLSQIIAQQPITTENSNIVDIKSCIIGHPKTSHKSSKTIKQAKKV